MKAVIIDRDNTLNIDDTGYIRSESDMKLFPSVPEALNKIKLSGYKIFVLSNQSGIGRDKIKPEEYRKVNERFLRLAGDPGIIDEIFYCPHSPEDKCLCRKPGTMLLDIILKQFSIEAEKSFFIGDKSSDMECGRKEGLTTVRIIRDAGLMEHNDTESGDIIIKSLSQLQDII